MQGTSFKFWYSPIAKVNVAANYPVFSFGTDREIIFTATENITYFLMSKGSIGTNQSVYLDYVTITEVLSQVNVISCVEIQEALARMVYMGQSTTDQTLVTNYLNKTFNRTYTYSEYATVIAQCNSTTHPVNYVLAKEGAEAGSVKASYARGFNGMEKDDETYGEGNAYDFGARIYDSRLGRWLSVDPLQEDYPYASPYNFCLNSPIGSIDPDGQKVKVTRLPNQGKDGRDLVITKIDAKWVDKTGRFQALQAQRIKVANLSIEKPESGKYKRQSKKLERMQKNYDQYAAAQIKELKETIEETYNGMDHKTEWRTEVNISDGSVVGVESTDHVFYAVSEVIDAEGRANMIGGLAFYYSPNSSGQYFTSKKVKAHEIGHLLGLLHNSENLFDGKAIEYLTEYKHNAAIFNAYGISPNNLMDHSKAGMDLSPLQLGNIEYLFDKGHLNKGNNTFDPNHGKSTPSESNNDYKINYKKN